MFLVCLSLVSAENYYNKDSLDVNLRLSSEINIVPSSDYYKVSKVETKLYFYPKDDFQQAVLTLETNPSTFEEDGYLLYAWQNPDVLKLKYDLEAQVRVFDNIHKIKEKIKFPLDDLPDTILAYTKAGEIIDSDNGAIGLRASNLVEGEDDLFVVVHKVASWVTENIDYDLSTLTVKSSQKASWVLENRIGVCDEMTSLFIAMLRSLGIPAKFVSGISYSNDPQFAEPWQAHGWAEVYFQGYGWVPFDVTFDEYGYADPTHIKLHESLDGDSATTRFEWLGKNIDLEVEELDIDVNILKVGSERVREVDLRIEVLEEEVGFGSYNLVKVEIENLKNYYVAKTLYLGSTPEIEITDETRHILLKPGEIKTEYWILKVESGLDSKYVYTFPVEIRTEKNTSAEASFNSKEGLVVVSKSEIQARLNDLVEEEEKVLSKDVDVSCVIEDESIGFEEESGVSCLVKNKGNTVLRDLNVCLGGDCEKVNLNINEEKSFSSEVRGEEVGAQQFLVSVKNQEVSKVVYVDYAVLDVSRIVIKDLEYPGYADYGDEFVISFTLEKTSFSNPQNIRVVLFHEGYPNEWLMEELTDDKKFAVNFGGSALGFGENEFEIVVEWSDSGEKKMVSKDFTIQLGETSFGEKINVLLGMINRFLENLF